MSTDLLRVGRAVVVAGVVGLVILAAGVRVDGTGAAFGPAIVRAATPDATEAPGGDTRSPGEGPGFVGAPLMAIGGVLAIGLGAALLTLLVIRLTSGPETGQPKR